MAADSGMGFVLLGLPGQGFGPIAEQEHHGGALF